MTIHNSPYSYGVVAKSLHWVMALLIIGTWIIGYYAIGLPDDSPKQTSLLSFHGSLGMLILMLVIVRLSWRLYDRAPPIKTPNKLVITAAYTIHYLLYAFMFILPLSGWVMMSLDGDNPTFFGLFTFPSLVTADPGNEICCAIHYVCAMLLLTLFIAHISLALLQHFVFKDNTLRRMLVH